MYTNCSFVYDSHASDNDEGASLKREVCIQLTNTFE